MTGIESESQHKLVQSSKFLKPPCALGYQSENVNKMDAHKFINDFDTKKLGQIIGKGGKMTIVMSEIMWSKINVSSDSKLLCGLLIILFENIASPGDLHSLKMDKEDFLSVPD